MGEHSRSLEFSLSFMLGNLCSASGFSLGERGNNNNNNNFMPIRSRSRARDTPQRPAIPADRIVGKTRRTRERRKRTASKRREEWTLCAFPTLYQLIDRLGASNRTFEFSLVPGHAMLMRPNKAETAVHGCHCSGDMACACAIPRSFVVCSLRDRR